LSRKGDQQRRRTPYQFWRYFCWGTVSRAFRLLGRGYCLPTTDSKGTNPVNQRARVEPSIKARVAVNSCPCGYGVAGNEIRPCALAKTLPRIRRAIDAP